MFKVLFFLCCFFTFSSHASYEFKDADEFLKDVDPFELYKDKRFTISGVARPIYSLFKAQKQKVRDSSTAEEWRNHCYYVKLTVLAACQFDENEITAEVFGEILKLAAVFAGKEKSLLDNPTLIDAIKEKQTRLNNEKIENNLVQRRPSRPNIHARLQSKVLENAEKKGKKNVEFVKEIIKKYKEQKENAQRTPLPEIVSVAGQNPEEQDLLLPSASSQTSEVTIQNNPEIKEPTALEESAREHPSGPRNPSNISSMIDLLNEKIEKLKNKKNEQRTKIEEYKQTIEEQKEKLKKADNQLNQLSLENKKKKDQIKTFSAEVDTLKLELAKKEKERTHNEEVLKSLQKTISDTKLNNLELTEKLKKLSDSEEKQKKLENDAAYYKRLIGNLQNEIKSLREEKNQELKKEIEKYRNQQLKNEVDNDVYKQRFLSQIESTKKLLEEEKQKTTELSQKVEAYEKEKKNKEEGSATLAKTRKELEDMRKEHTAFTHEITKLREENEVLKKEQERFARDKDEEKEKTISALNQEWEEKFDSFRQTYGPQAHHHGTEKPCEPDHSIAFLQGQVAALNNALCIAINNRPNVPKDPKIRELPHYYHYLEQEKTEVFTFIPPHIQPNGNVVSQATLKVVDKDRPPIDQKSFTTTTFTKKVDEDNQ